MQTTATGAKHRRGIPARTLVLVLLLATMTGLRAQPAPEPSNGPTRPTTPASPEALRLAQEQLASLAALVPVTAPATPSGPTTGTTAAAVDPALQAGREMAARARSLVDLLSRRPEPIETTPFLVDLGQLRDLADRRRQEAALATGRADLETAAGNAERARLTARQAAFAEEQARILDRAVAEAEARWVAAYPDEAVRRAAEAKVFEAISRTRASEGEEARNRAAAQAVHLETTLREAKDLAEKAQQELEAARTEGEIDLAQRRFDYARLKAEAEEARGRALEAEVAARDAEARLEATRAELAEALPRLTGEGAGGREAAEARRRWTEAAATDSGRARILAEEIRLGQQEVPHLRTRVKELAEEADRLEASLESHQSDLLYRRRVFFARLGFRSAGDRLDEFRTMLEWRERERQAHERRARSLTEAAERLAPLAERRILGSTVDEWSRFLFRLLLAALGALLTDFLFRMALQRIAKRTVWAWDDIAVTELQAPVVLFVVIWGTSWATDALAWAPGVAASAARWTNALRTAWTGFLLWRILNIFLGIVEPRLSGTDTQLDDQLFRFVARGVRFVLVSLTAVFVLEAFGWAITSLLAGLGLGGLAIALAAQDTLANLFGSIVLFLDRPFKVGNVVVIGDVEGVVEEIGIRSTRIRTFKDTLITIPNAKVASSSAENIHSFRRRRLLFELQLRLDTPPAKVEEAIRAIRQLLVDDPMVHEDHYVYLTAIKDWSLEVMVWCFVATRDWGEWLERSQEIYLAILRKLEELGVKLAYPAHRVELGSPAGLPPPLKGGP